MSQTLAASSGATARRGATRWGGAEASRTSMARTSGRGSQRPTLRVVTAPVLERSRTLFVLTCLLLLVGGLISLLIVNTSLAQGSFRMHDLRATSAGLSEQAQALREDIALRESPQQLSVAASALGMVPSGSVAFLRLSDGAVLGVAKPAPAPPRPTVAPSPSATKAATTATTAAPTAASTSKPASKPASTSTAKATSKPTSKATTAKAPTAKAPTAKAPTAKPTTAR